MNKLLKGAKPCPFCGSIDIRMGLTGNKKGDTWWNVICHDCWTEKKYYESEEDALKGWNRRMGDKNES